MRSGLAIINMSEDNTTTYFIDSELFKSSNINNRLRYAKRVEQSEYIDCHEQKRCKNKKKNAKNKMSLYTKDAIKYIISRIIFLVASICAMYFKLINPIIAVAVVISCLCMICFRIGAWYGISRAKE